MADRNIGRADTFKMAYGLGNLAEAFEYNEDEMGIDYDGDGDSETSPDWSAQEATTSLWGWDSVDGGADGGDYMVEVL